MPRHLSTFLILSVTLPLRAAELPPVARWQLDRGHLTTRSIRPLAGRLNASFTGPIKFSTNRKSGPTGTLELSGQSSPRQRFQVATDIGRASAILPAKQLTVSAWLRIDAAGEWSGFVSAVQDNGTYEKGWILGQHLSRFTFALCSTKTGKLTYLESPRLFETGHWYHVVGTYDGKRQKLFVDGQLQGESTAQSGPIAYPPKGVVTLGAYEDDNEYYPLVGALERVSIWDTALADRDVKRLFQQRSRKFPGITATRPQVVDWPTWNRDNQRTGVSEQPLKLPLVRQWTHRIPAPSPAWPAPARQDFWHRKQDLSARVPYARVTGDPGPLR